jgi:hypothetical protein
MTTLAGSLTNQRPANPGEILTRIVTQLLLAGDAMGAAVLLRRDTVIQLHQIIVEFLPVVAWIYSVAQVGEKQMLRADKQSDSNGLLVAVVQDGGK